MSWIVFQFTYRTKLARIHRIGCTFACSTKHTFDSSRYHTHQVLRAKFQASTINLCSDTACGTMSKNANSNLFIVSLAAQSGFDCPDQFCFRDIYTTSSIYRASFKSSACIIREIWELQMFPRKCKFCWRRSHQNCNTSVKVHYFSNGLRRFSSNTCLYSIYRKWIESEDLNWALFLVIRTTVIYSCNSRKPANRYMAKELVLIRQRK